jgi:prepilin-type N-terminal cleavage/methylation domain-containing protein
MEGFTSRVTHSVLHERGLTLIELLIAVSILVIISGTTYTAFNMAMDVYQKTGSRIVMTQKCRIALDRVVTDLSNMQAVQGDEALSLISLDNPQETGDRDLISFVTLIHATPDPFLAELNAARGFVGEGEEDQEPIDSDVQRVSYYIGRDPIQEQGHSALHGAMLGRDSEESEVEETSALLRVTTASLNPETVIQPLLETGTLPTEDEEGNPIGVDIVPIINQIVSFDLKYFDGEEWYDSWESSEMIPKAVEVSITVASEGSSQSRIQVRRQEAKRETQSTMVYLLMSANFSEQPPSGPSTEPGAGTGG